MSTKAIVMFDQIYEAFTTIKKINSRRKMDNEEDKAEDEVEDDTEKDRTYVPRLRKVDGV